MKIPLNTKNGLQDLDKGIKQLYLRADIENYTGIPLDISEYIIKRHSVQPEQMHLDDFNNNKINKEEYERLIRKIENPEFSQKKINHFIDLLVGTTKDGKKILIFDEDRDFNFQNDIIIYLNKDKSYKTAINFEVWLNKNITKKTLSVELIFSNNVVKYNSLLENKFLVLISLDEHKYGHFIFNNHKISIELNNTFPTAKYTKSNTQINFSSHPDKTSYEIGDTVKIESKYFKILNISTNGDTLLVDTTLNVNADTRGFRQGWKIPDIVLNDIHGNPSQISYHKNNYTLIDFWASWCGPCRANTPNIKKLKTQYKAKGLIIYGISFDTKKEIWLNAIKKDKLDWVNLSDLKGWDSPISEVFRINAIPLYLLVDNDGEILLRESDFKVLNEKIIHIIK